jgi:predicted O-methyltransferase YrrM
MSNRPLAIDDRLYQYIIDVAVQETPAQLALREATRDHPASVMQIAPDQGQFMSFLVKLIGARQIVEIGTFTGYSALCMAQALPDDGQLVCCDISEEYTAVGRPFWSQAGVAERIDLRIAPALDTLDALAAEGRSFDMAFIDADKENYAHYFERCLRLVRAGGLILFDNTLWSGQVADPRCDDPDTLALRALNNALSSDPRVDIALATIADGLTLARVR